MANNTILDIKNLSKIYRVNNKDFKALDNVNLRVYQSESLGIVGESGSGKSTLAKIITQIEKPSAGQIVFDGRDIIGVSNKHKYDVRKNIQMVFQNPISVISPKMMIGDFLTEGMLNYGMISKSDKISEATRLLSMVELSSSFIYKFPSELSGGEMQRVVVARAISVNPKIIIFDEATSALDVLVRKNILNLLVDLKKKLDISYIFIGHNLAVVRLVTDRIAVMNEGKVIEIIESENFSKKATQSYTNKLIDSVLTTDDRK